MSMLFTVCEPVETIMHPLSITFCVCLYLPRSLDYSFALTTQYILYWQGVVLAPYWPKGPLFPWATLWDCETCPPEGEFMCAYMALYIEHLPCVCYSSTANFPFTDVTVLSPLCLLLPWHFKKMDARSQMTSFACLEIHVAPASSAKENQDGKPQSPPTHYRVFVHHGVLEKRDPKVDVGCCGNVYT